METSALNLDRICLFFKKWLNSDPFDVGMTTRTALKAIDINRLNPSDSFRNSYLNTRSSESNGCLMRITPLAVFGHRLSKEKFREELEKAKTEWKKKYKIKFENYAWILKPKN